jgi:threonyl-tRNA synthetase
VYSKHKSWSLGGSVYTSFTVSFISGVNWRIWRKLQTCHMSQTNLEKTADLSYFTDKSGENCRPVICHRQIWRKLQTCHMSQTNLEKTADLSYVTDKSGENCRPVICHRQIWRKLQTCHMSQTNLNTQYCGHKTMKIKWFKT